jgi:hypothetical protein
MIDGVNSKSEALISKGPFKRIPGSYISPKTNPDNEVISFSVSKAKRDRYGNEIDKSKKLQHISFIDLITGKNLADIKEVESYKEYNVLDGEKSEKSFCVII